MLHTGRLFTGFYSPFAKVAYPCWKGKINQIWFVSGKLKFRNLDTPLTRRKVVLLFTGNLTGMATDAMIIADQ